MDKNKMIEEEKDRYLILLESFVVSRCYLDYAFGIQFFRDEFNIDIRIEGVFVFNDGSIKMHCDPSIKSTVGPALEVFGLAVQNISAFKTGCLEISFENQKRIFIPSDKNYESWQISSSNGLLIVSLPLEGVAIWSPPDQ